ncbi:MAG: hypothetical protein MAG453_00066 [Calditrichaeota bacterium]|nr:hypothetical protein [Calditrichota bacterium]
MAESKPGPEGPQPGSLRRVLLVDDNDRYAAAISEDLHRRGVVEIVRVASAAEGVRVLGERGDEFDGVVSDISMESQLSGLKVLRHARRGENGRRMLACATTGLDTWAGYAINRLVLGALYRCDYLIPKRPIKHHGRTVWVRVARVWRKN